MHWSYRIMRHVERVADNDETYYAMHRVFYDEGNAAKSWTAEPCGSPFGETLEEMISDLGWIIAGLSKPVLDFETGKEIEPVAMLADDLAKMLRERQVTPAGRSALAQDGDRGGVDG